MIKGNRLYCIFIIHDSLFVKELDGVQVNRESVNLSYLFNDEEKINLVDPECLDRNVGNDGNDLPLETVEKTLKLILISGHLEVKPVNFVVHNYFLSNHCLRIGCRFWQHLDHIEFF